MSFVHKTERKGRFRIDNSLSSRILLTMTTDTDEATERVNLLRVMYRTIWTWYAESTVTC